MHGSQLPQSSVPPQPSAIGPHVNPSDAQVRGTHGGHVGGGPPSGSHGPQSRISPQPSPALPQQMPCSAQVVGTQMPPQSTTTYALGGSVVTPQQPGSAAGAQGPVPQLMTLPHPSRRGPHGHPGGTLGGACSAQSTGTQVDEAHELHCPGTPPAPHAWPAGQGPQSSVDVQPSDTGPHV